MNALEKIYLIEQAYEFNDNEKVVLRKLRTLIERVAEGNSESERMVLDWLGTSTKKLELVIRELPGE